MATLGRGNTRAGTAAVGVLLVLSPLGLAACGGGEDPTSSDDESVEVPADYCADIRAVKGVLASVATVSELYPAQFGADFDAVRQLAGDAPAELASDWETYVDGLDQYEAALNDAGVTVEEMAGGFHSLGLTEHEQRALASRVGTILYELDLQTASENIRSHARKACDIDFTFEVSNDSDAFCTELGNASFLGVDSTARQAAGRARTADQLRQDAPDEIEARLTAIAHAYRAMAHEKDKLERSMIYIRADVITAVSDLHAWGSNNC